MRRDPWPERILLAFVRFGFRLALGANTPRLLRRIIRPPTAWAAYRLAHRIGRRYRFARPATVIFIAQLEPSTGGITLADEHGNFSKSPTGNPTLTRFNVN